MYFRFWGQLSNHHFHHHLDRQGQATLLQNNQGFQYLSRRLSKYKDMSTEMAKATVYATLSSSCS